MILAIVDIYFQWGTIFMPSNLCTTLLIATSTTMLCNLGCAYANDKPYGAHADISGKYSSMRSLGELELFVPLAQSRNTLLFADVRGMVDTEGSKEGNFGLGLRHIINDRVIIGGYGFYDRRRSSNNFNYNEITLGTEIMTEKFDLRFNYYGANNNFREINRTSNTVVTGTDIALSGDPYLYGNTVWSGGLLEHTTTTNIFGETALDGWDIEAGAELFRGLRAFGGYYKFSSPESDEVTGPKARLEWNIGDSFNKDTKWKISLNAEITDDKVRGTNTWGGIRLRIPFGSKHTKSSSNSRLMNRMTETIRRDVDVVTGASQNAEVSVSHTDTTTQLSDANMNYWFVDNTASGSDDGSFENPFDTLKEAEAASSENDIIFVYAGDGTSTGYHNGFVMQNSQSLIGEYMGLTWDDTTLIAEGDRPSITHTQTDSIIIELANANTISGLSLNGNNISNVGINSVSGTGYYNIENNIITQLIGDGLSFNSPEQIEITLRGNTITNNQGTGLKIFDGENIELDVIENDISNNNHNGIRLDTIRSVVINLEYNRINDNGLYGFMSWGSRDIRISASKNLINNNGYTGFNLTSFSRADVTFEDNEIHNNHSAAIALYGSSLSNLVLRNNHISNNYILVQAGGPSLMIFEGNFINDRIFLEGGHGEVDFGSGPGGSAGMNCITDTLFTTFQLAAHNNWWGQAGGPTSDQVWSFEGTEIDIDTSSPLTEAPEHCAATP